MFLFAAALEFSDFHEFFCNGLTVYKSLEQQSFSANIRIDMTQFRKLFILQEKVPYSFKGYRSFYSSARFQKKETPTMVSQKNVTAAILFDTSIP